MLQASNTSGARPPGREARASMPMQVRDAALIPETVNAEARTVEVVWTTGATVRRVDWWTWEEYDETLLVTPQACNLERMNAGAHVLNAHQQRDMANIVGVVRKAWIENGEGRALVEFSRRPEIEGFWADVRAGIIRNISVGYTVEEWTIVKRDDGPEARTATRWTPAEISFVPVPADPGAGTRSASAENGVALYPYTVNLSGRQAAEEKESRSMPGEADQTQTNTPAGGERRQAPAAPAAPVINHDPAGDAALNAVRAAERERIQGINARAAALNIEGDFVRNLIDQGVDLDVASTRLIDEHARQARGAHQPSRVQGGEDNADPAVIRERMSAAIAARATAHLTSAARVEMTDAAREFAGMSILEMGLELARARGENGLGRRMAPAAMYDRLTERSHTTSDFPVLLSGTTNRVLLAQYGAVAPTFRMVMRQRNFRDFRPTKVVRLGDFPTLKAVGEDGEFKFGTIEEGSESVVLGSFGRILGLSRRVLINDDLNAFADLPVAMANRIRTFENSTAWGVVLANGKLSDGKAFFHTDHKNTAAGAALDEAGITAARKAMMTQKGLDKEEPEALGITPRYLVVGPDYLTDAEKLVANITPTKSSDFNPFAGKLEVIGEAKITGKKHYFAADPSMHAGFIFGYLEGAEAPRVASREGFTTDGIEFKVALDFAAGGIDHRPWYMNPGP